MSSNYNMGSSTPCKGEIDHMALLSEHVGGLYLNSEYSDVMLKVKDETFHAHKVILAARCQYFRALLFGGMKESKQYVVEFADMNVESFKILLRYIYTGHMSLKNLSDDSILEMLGLAHKYGFLDLESAISDYLRDSLTTSNVCSIFAFSRLYQLQSLTSVCKKFIDNSSHEVFKSPGFLNLSSECLREIIESDSFYLEELKIFEAVVAWGKANNLDNKSPEMQTVLSAIRFSLMSFNELFFEVRPTGLVTSEDILDALQLQFVSDDYSLPYRGILKPNENLAQKGRGAIVLKGEMRTALLDGDTQQYDLDRGYTRHVINDHSDGGIVIQLAWPAIVNHIRVLLWDKDLRSYTYYIEVSVNQKHWVRIIDYEQFHCRSWQKLSFEPRVVKYINIAGTYNTVNRVFHAVSFEVMYLTEPLMIKDHFVIPKHNVARTEESACVIDGVCRSRNSLLDGNTTYYDWDSGYTCHQLGSGHILIQLGQPYLIDSMRLLLWDCDDRNYSYYVEVSTNLISWETVCDRRNQKCKSWQLVTFPMRPVVYIKIVGTRNTANEVFHLIHFECPAQCDEALIEAERLRVTSLEEKEKEKPVDDSVENSSSGDSPSPSNE